MVVGSVTGRNFKRSKIRQLKVAGICAAVLLLFVFAGNSAVQDVSAEQEEQQVASTQAADKVAVSIAAINKQLNDLTQDQAIVTLFAEADAATLESTAEQMQSVFESALKLRLFLPGNYKIDREAIPPLSFASLDLLRRAEESEAPVAAEVHSMGGNGAHIAFVSRVADADNNLVGLLHLSIPMEIIGSAISGLDNPEIYIEIQQGKGGKALALTRLGDNKLRNGIPVAVAIKGTKWNAVSWQGSPETTAATLPSLVGGSESAEEGSGRGLMITILLVLAAAGAGGFVFYRRKQSGLVSKEEPEKQVVYQGAVKAIMEGAHPGFEKLVPGLPPSDKPPISGKVSQGLQGDDIKPVAKQTKTSIAKHADGHLAGIVVEELGGIIVEEEAGIVVEEVGSNEVAVQDSATQENPVQENPDLEFPEQENTDQAVPDLEFPEQENTDQAVPDLEFPEQENTAQANPVQVNIEADPVGAELSPEVEAPSQVDLSPVIFRAYDIRGVVGETLSASVVHEIGRAIGSEAHERGQQSVVVARDGRLSGPELIEALIKGLRASGRDVIDIGMVPTPVLYFATHHLETQSGVMLTGSHNGPEYNGLKIVLDGETLSGDAITKIRDRITNNELSEGQGSLQTTDVGADYLRRITEDVPVALGGAFKIIVDCGNGVAGQLAPQLYRAMGHDVVELFCDIDGKFPNHQPDPSQPENLQPLIEIVKEEGADLGFAFDGDGDRLGIVDGAGNIIWPDRQMMLFARDVLSRNQGASIIFDVKCSRYLKEVIEESGGKPLMWKTGHSLIKSKMKEIDAPLGGEFSGHIFFKERWYGFDDALYAGARVLEILTNSKGSPTETFAELPDGISTPELRIPLAEKYHAKAMAIMKKKMTFEDAEVIDIDGLRVDFSGGWGLVRPSNTSPFLVARFEAESEAELERIQTIFRVLLRSVSADLKLPF